LKPPVRKGDQVARLRVSSTVQAGAEPTAMSEVPLYAAADVEPSGFVWRGLDSLVYLALRWAHL
jgi:D-alanyl-D-alanine carboxypeptidase (penicillin-binding protein 5/6)